MEKPKRIGPTILFISVLGVLILNFLPLFNTYIVEPLVLLFWAAWRIAASVDQNVYWIIICVVCFIPLIRFIQIDEEQVIHPSYRRQADRSPRVRYWQDLFREASSGEEELNHLRLRLKDLLLAVIAQNEKSKPVDLENVMESKLISLSQAARRYLFPAGEKKNLATRIGQFHLPSRAAHKIQAWTRRFARRDASPYDEILQWMESAMEINHDQ